MNNENEYQKDENDADHAIKINIARIAVLNDYINTASLTNITSKTPLKHIGEEHPGGNGGSGDDNYPGTSGDDTWDGGGGNDTADGGAGKDHLYGDDGDDTLSGGDGNDIMNGDAGNDVLDGGAGSDKMTGGTGDDTYYVDTKKDAVTEKANGGTDTVISHIDYTLGKEIENLQLMSGMDHQISGTGNKSDNTLTGNESINTINGKEGNDILVGGAGADIFKFDTKLNATTNVDTISDFISGTDDIYLSKKILSKYKAGDVLAADFVAGAGATAHSANEHFLYDTTTGALSYDADGSGTKSAAVHFATLTGHPDLVASDLHIF